MNSSGSTARDLRGEWRFRPSPGRRHTSGAVGLGAKGGVTFSPEPVVDYESFKTNQDGELADLAWLYNMNRRIYMTPGRE